MGFARPQLRWYQQNGVDQIRSAFREGAIAPLAVAPTGAGKTVLFSYIAESASARGNRVCIVAHRVELLDQISLALDQFGVPHGIIAPGYSPKLWELVQVASVQTLARRLTKAPLAPFDLLVIDEAHHVLPDNSWGRVYRALGAPMLLGVTASPARTDGRGLGRIAGGLFDRLIEIVDVQTLIDQAFLTPPAVYAPPSNLDLTGVAQRGGDYDKSELAARVDKPVITGDAIAHYERLCRGQTAVAFAVSIKHCEHIAGQFRESGYRFEVIDGTMESKRRDHLIKGLGNDHQGLVSCDLIGEGVDIPAISCAIMLRPTGSLIVHVQQMGRALRPIYAPGFDRDTVEGRRAAMIAGGKTHATILDHVGNTMKHGLPETPREWSLAGEIRKKGTKGKKEPSLSVRQCGTCYAVFRPAPICPHCGTAVDNSGRDVTVVEGELERVTSADLDMVKRQQRAEVGAAKSLDALQAIEKARGYKPGWAKHVWDSRPASRRASAPESMGAS